MHELFIWPMFAVRFLCPAHSSFYRHLLHLCLTNAFRNFHTDFTTTHIFSPIKMADQPPSTNSEVTTAGAKSKKAAAKAQAKARRAEERIKEKASKEKAKSVAKTVEDRLLKDLGSSLKTHARSATFACGGTLRIKQPGVGKIVQDTEAEADVSQTLGDKHEAGGEVENAAGGSARQPHTELKIFVTDNSDKPANTDTTSSNDKATKVVIVNDVQVRFGENGKGFNTVFSSDGVSPQELEQLILACQPTSFGRNGEAILDEGYRKAGKLDVGAFATSFCPYEAGIVDVVAQLLVPQTPQDKHARSIKVRRQSSTGIETLLTNEQAELYKLNVYSGPHGKFKSHVDTPRSKDQIGSLVVSLPAPHQGESAPRIFIDQKYTHRVSRWCARRSQCWEGDDLRLVHRCCDHQRRGRDQVGRVLQRLRARGPRTQVWQSSHPNVQLVRHSGPRTSRGRCTCSRHRAAAPLPWSGGCTRHSWLPHAW